MRSIAASLLALVMVCGSLFSSMCDLSCQLGLMERQCTGASVAHAAMPMRCSGDMTQKAAEQAMSACSGMHCSDRLIIADLVRANRSSFLSVMAGSVVERLIAPALVLVPEGIRLARPPLYASESRPRSISLRI